METALGGGSRILGDDHAGRNVANRGRYRPPDHARRPPSRPRKRQEPVPKYRLQAHKQRTI